MKSRLRLISAVVYNLPFTSPTPQVSEIPKFVDMWFSTMEGIVDGEDAYKKLEQVGKCYSYVHKPIMVGSGVRLIFSVSFYNLPQHFNDLPHVPQPFYDLPQPTLDWLLHAARPLRVANKAEMCHCESEHIFTKPNKHIYTQTNRLAKVGKMQ